MSTVDDVSNSPSSQDLLSAALNQSGLTMLDSPVSVYSDETDLAEDPLAALGLVAPSLNESLSAPRQVISPSTVQQTEPNVSDPPKAVSLSATTGKQLIKVTQQGAKIFKVPIPKTGTDRKPNIIRIPISLTNGARGPILLKKSVVCTQASSSTSIVPAPKIITKPNVQKVQIPTSSGPIRVISTMPTNGSSNQSNAGSAVEPRTYARMMVGGKKILIPIIKKNGVHAGQTKVVIPTTCFKKTSGVSMPTKTIVRSASIDSNVRFVSVAQVSKPNVEGPGTIVSGMAGSKKQPLDNLNLGSLFVESAEKELPPSQMITAAPNLVNDRNNNSGMAHKVILSKPAQQSLFYTRNCISPLSPVVDILSTISNMRPHSPLLGRTSVRSDSRSSSPGVALNAPIVLGSAVENDKQRMTGISRSQSVTTFYKNSRTKSTKDFSMIDLKNQTSMEMKKPSDELVQEEEWEEEQAQHASTYAEYKPSKLTIGLPHPDSVVETSSLSSVPPPDITYRLSIPDETIDNGLLSALQLETITYACQKHETFLPGGERAGFLIGDGAGVGKGRTIAGIIFENYLLGRKRALWFSVSNDLKFDSERDLRDIGAKSIPVHMLNKFKYGKISSRENSSVKKGVIFATYSSLIGESHSNSKYGTRLKQILHWCGRDFDGAIVFDECHKAKNLIPSGSAKPTKTGYTVLDLQKRLPNARIIYASATGASEPRNMAYMSRIGLWGEGTSFNDFMDFIQAVERRGVGAMEMVAIDLKSRGAYIARQLSFHGVSFRIHEVALPSAFIKVYNAAVHLWVAAREAFQISASLIDAEHHMKKTMWGQFWAAHQRFFKYLCIAAKVDHTSQLAREAVKHGKCVVIGLQSTGEARTLDQLDKAGGELDDFVSTAKGVFENLIEHHFPAPNRKRVTDLFGKDFYKQDDESDDDEKNKAKRKRTSAPKRTGQGQPPSKKKRQTNDSESNGGASTDEATSSSDEDAYIKFSGYNSDVSLDYSDEDLGKIFGGGSDSDEWSGTGETKSKHKTKTGKKTKKADSDMDEEADRMLEMAGLKAPSATPVATVAKEAEKPLSSFQTTSNVDVSGLSSMKLPGLGPVERAQALKQELLDKLQALSLPNNTLDELIDSLGGPENVAEMTGRKGRIVSTEQGNIQYESRTENDVRCDMLNLAEKQRFMDGEKNIAIISEAASSGISLQSDRRARNQRRRLHITLELPWSADRAIQQFGRTHRSNQVNAPEYVFLISELAGEQRFASVVAKRLESLGALTHGDRRATETRDLSQYNFDNKFGRLALESIMKAIAGLELPIVQPPATYPGLFFRDIRHAMVGVGLISLDAPGAQAQLEKEYNNIVKFMNRILGMEVLQQNAVFQFFADTLSAIVQKAKSRGQFDQGIMDVGSGADGAERVDCKRFALKPNVGLSNGSAPEAEGGYVELHTVKIERGMAWNEAELAWSEMCVGDCDGFYVTHLKRNGKCMAVLAVEGRTKSRRQDDTTDVCRFFVLHRPNTGKQLKRESLATLQTRFKKVTPDEARNWWENQYMASLDICSHAYWQGFCNRQVNGVPCSIGKRRRTYHVLSGSVLAIWRLIEKVLTLSAPAMYKMQIVRLKTEEGGKLVGLLIPSNCVPLLINHLSNPAQMWKIGNTDGSEYQQVLIQGNQELKRTMSTPMFVANRLSTIANDVESDGSFEDVDEEVDENYSPDEMMSSVLFPSTKKYSWLS